jgi:hypothetical protein
MANDLVEVSLQGEQDLSTPGFPFSTGFVRHVRVFFDVVNSSGRGKTLPDDPDPFSDPTAPDAAATDMLPSPGGKS